MAIFIDKRFTVNGQASRLTLDNHINLDKHIQEVMQGYIDIINEVTTTVIIQVPLVNADTVVTTGINLPFTTIPNSLTGYTVNGVKLNTKTQDGSATTDSEFQVTIDYATVEITIPAGKLTGQATFTPYPVDADGQISVEVIAVDGVEPPKGLVLTVEFIKTV